LYRLVARFDINLSESSFLLFERPRTDDLCYKTTIGDFDVELCLNPDVTAYRNIQKSDASFYPENDYWATSKVRIQSVRNEDVPLPIDNEERRKYFEEREPAYRQAGLEVLNRAMLFFKYRLHNPCLSAGRYSGKGFLSPVWMDESGNKLKHSGGYGVGKSLPELGRFSVKSLSHQNDHDLEEALQNPISPNMIEELLSDGQSAVFEGNLRRAIMEIAIATETAVKQAFFAKATPAGAAYEYLEDKGRVRILVTDLISSVAKEAFGKSFREDEKSHYENIDFLFRCRNKVAHRGELTYKDDSGSVNPVDEKRLSEWWESVEILLDWLCTDNSP